MKHFIQAAVSISLFLGSIGSADACCLWPFGGWWGAGYGAAPAYGYAPAPAYGYYSAGYPSWNQPAYGYVSAGYASADCCAPSCCNPCGTGACASGSCAGVTPTGTGTLKPANDPNFKDGTSKEDYDQDLDPAPVKPKTDELEEFDSPRRSRTTEPDPNDDFQANPMGGAGRGSDIPFGADGDQINNKPPMPDAKDLPAVEPGTGSEFLDGEKNNSDTSTEKPPQARLLPKSPAERSSGLSEVIAPTRMASRALPSFGPRSATSWAGKTSDDKKNSAAPVRWISVPMPEGQVRL